ncbi:hypothetical protein [Pseudoroseomonas ludipueritiae]|uniref:hypothetical protein n=1 Tax=Pseudoroseomonas ludipueritiae TaxID=198093 RepID=UPI0019329980|nr:hypothetical protein [Pseudoroseomonas ludipueritiae]
MVRPCWSSSEKATGRPSLQGSADEVGQLFGRVLVENATVLLWVDQVTEGVVLDRLGHQPAVAPRAAAMRRITRLQPASLSMARSIASWRMARPRLASLGLPRRRPRLLRGGIGGMLAGEGDRHDRNNSTHMRPRSGGGR